MLFELSFRVTLVYLILLRPCVMFFFRGGLHQSLYANMDVVERVGRYIARLISVLPLVCYVVTPGLTWDVDLGLSDEVRWMAIVPALGILVWTMWSLHLTSGPDDGIHTADALPRLFQAFPYRVFRYPLELGTCAYALSLAVLTGRLLPCIGATVSIFTTFLVVLPRREKRLRELVARSPTAPIQRRRLMLPVIPKAHYQVPRRFGLGAILGIMTLLCLVFGVLNAMRTQENIPYAVDLFLVGQFLMICAAQMFFKTAPRAVSALSGTILLPLTFAVAVAIEDRQSHTIEFILGMTCLILPGALIGYCMGALGAGVFLLADKIESWTVRNTLPAPVLPPIPSTSGTDVGIPEATADLKRPTATSESDSSS